MSGLTKMQWTGIAAMLGALVWGTAAEAQSTDQNDGAVASQQDGSNKQIAIGYNSSATSGIFNIAVGVDAAAHKSTVNGGYASAFGTNANAIADNASAFGASSKASGVGAVALGVDTVASGQYSLAAGLAASATGNYANATGYQSEATAQSSAYGSFAKATGGFSTAIGNQARAESGFDIAVGNEAKASGGFAIATGYLADASGAQSIASGTGAHASAAGSIAIGAGANASAANSVALGSASVADRANTVSVGAAGTERQITNVAAGTYDTDAVNVAQLKAVQNDVSELRSESRHGIAAAMAMAAVPMPSAPGKIAWGINGANYKDAYAGAFSAAYRFNMAMPLVASASVGYAGSKTAGVRIGLSGEF
jgi:hypothetical protein